MKYKGSCHCGAVTFTVEAPEIIEADECNCSICTKGGFLHLIVPTDSFTLLTGEDGITTYTFNTEIAQHYFCKVCGIKPFYIPRSNPDAVDINVRCLDTTPKSVRVIQFDGQHWEDNAHKLVNKSKKQ